MLSTSSNSNSVGSTMAQQAGAALMFEVNPIADAASAMGLTPSSMAVPSLNDLFEFSQVGHTNTNTADKPGFACSPRSEVAIVADCQDTGDSFDADQAAGTWGLFHDMLPFDDSEGEGEAVLPHTPPRSPSGDHDHDHDYDYDYDDSHYDDSGDYSHADSLDSRVPDLSIEIPPLNTEGMPALSAEMDGIDDDAGTGHGATIKREGQRHHGTRSARSATEVGSAPLRSGRASKPAIAKKERASTASKAGSSKALKALSRPKILPPGHKPARGRGRQIQLSKMTAAQKKAEAGFRLEKNRQAARDFRLRRKNQVQVLEEQVTVYADRDRTQLAQIAQLEAQVARLRAAMQA